MSVLPILLFLAVNVQAYGEPAGASEPRPALTQASGPGLWIGGIPFGREDIRSAEQSWDGYSGSPNIILTLTDSGREKFQQAQDGRLGQPLEIAVDGELISSPHLAEPIEGHQVQISGTFTVDEAKVLARRLRGGSLADGSLERRRC